MGITKELLSANVTGLTEEQVSAVLKLSDNAFNQAIAARIGEIHGQYDNDIKSVTGQDKPQGVKTYDWLKNVLGELKTQAGTVDAYKSKIATLEEAVQAGAGNEAIKQQYTDLQSRFEQLQNLKETEDKEWAEKLETEAKRNTRLKLDYEFEKALTGVKFKSEEIIPKSVVSTFIDAAKSKILNNATPDWIDNGEGGQQLIFRGADGQILNNPDNQLSAYTARELLLKEITPILDKGKTQNGAGTAGTKKTSTGSTLDLSGAGTQVKATEQIAQHLLAKGLENASPAFQEEFSKIWASEKISALPFS